MANKWDGEDTNYSDGDTLPAADLNDTSTALANATIVNVYKDTSTADESTSSATYVDTTLSITETTGTNKCLVFFIGKVYNGSGDSNFRIVVDSTDLGEFAMETGDRYCTLIGITDTLSAASHTFKVQFKTNETHLYGDRATARLTVIELKI